MLFIQSHILGDVVMPENRSELRKIKNRIYKDYNVKYYTTHKFRDSDWSNFRKLIQSIQNVEGVNDVSYGTDPEHDGGYVWENGKMVRKIYIAE